MGNNMDSSEQGKESAPETKQNTPQQYTEYSSNEADRSTAEGSKSNLPMGDLLASDPQLNLEGIPEIGGKAVDESEGSDDKVLKTSGEDPYAIIYQDSNSGADVSVQVPVGGELLESKSAPVLESSSGAAVHEENVKAAEENGSPKRMETGEELNLVNCRDSIASTITDVSESYQTALEDSDRDGAFTSGDSSRDVNNYDDDDDDDDALANTLLAPQIQENFAISVEDNVLDGPRRAKVETVTVDDVALVVNAKTGESEDKATENISSSDLIDAHVSAVAHAMEEVGATVDGDSDQSDSTQSLDTLVEEDQNSRNSSDVIVKGSTEAGEQAEGCHGDVILKEPSVSVTDVSCTDHKQQHPAAAAAADENSEFESGLVERQELLETEDGTNPDIKFDNSVQHQNDGVSEITYGAGIYGVPDMPDITTKTSATLTPREECLVKDANADNSGAINDGDDIPSNVTPSHNTDFDVASRDGDNFTVDKVASDINRKVIPSDGDNFHSEDAANEEEQSTRQQIKDAAKPLEKESGFQEEVSVNTAGLVSEGNDNVDSVHQDFVALTELAKVKSTNDCFTETDTGQSYDVKDVGAGGCANASFGEEVEKSGRKITSGVSDEEEQENSTLVDDTWQYDSHIESPHCDTSTKICSDEEIHDQDLRTMNTEEQTGVGSDVVYTVRQSSSEDFRTDVEKGKILEAVLYQRLAEYGEKPEAVMMHEIEPQIAAVTAASLENPPWLPVEEPEPDYSSTSEDYSLSDDEEDLKPADIIDFSSLDTPMQTESSELEEKDDDVKVSVVPSPPADYSPLDLDTDEGHDIAMALTKPQISICSVDEESLVRISDETETVDSLPGNFRADVLADDDDDDEGMPIGQFQRRVSIRPSKRSRQGTRPRRSFNVPSSFTEHPEEEAGLNEVSFSPESSVFDGGDTPQPVGYGHGLFSGRLPTEESLSNEKPLLVPNTATSSSEETHISSSRIEGLERRNASRTHRAEDIVDETEWVKYEVVLRKDQGGFGMTISDSKPSIIMKVQENGVAAKSGIKEGDRIFKVNGSLVSNCSHDQVVHMIKSSGVLVSLVMQRNSLEAGAVLRTPSITDYMTSKPLKSPPSASMRYGRVLSPPEASMSPEDLQPFEDLNVLKQKPAYLAVFLNHLLAVGNPKPLLFSLITDYYQSNLKESYNNAKRWAYEIYSTFLVPKAPLKLNVDGGMVLSIGKTIQEMGPAKEYELRSLFQPIENSVRNEIEQQLAQFVLLKYLGQRRSYAFSYSLRRAGMDRQVELQIIEGALWKNFEQCLNEEQSESQHAIAYSLATFFRHVGYTGAKNSSLLDGCPTFVSKDKRVLKNKMKKHFAHKGHLFSPRQFTAVTQCHACQKVIWGLGHQAYQCSSCGLNVHRQCVEKITDSCLGNRTKDTKRTMRELIPGRRFQTSVREEIQKSAFLPLITDPAERHTRHLGERGEDYEANRHCAMETVTDRTGRPPIRPHSSACIFPNDSELDVDSELPQLTDFIPKEELRQMRDKERKKQQIINELFHTERLHVRTLRVMERVFLRPMQEDSAIDPEFIRILFPNLPQLIQMHDDLNKAFISLRKQKSVVDGVGLLLVRKLSGENGKMFKEACANFCADQAHALELLRVKQRKDPRCAALLQEAAANPLCKRLELKDFLPRQMQRLTKYPLLIDSLRKCTPPNTEEFNFLMDALKLSKGLLEYVNQEVKVIQNRRHLTDMQSRLDRRGFEAPEDSKELRVYRNLDLTKQSLIYDGEVTWKPFRLRPIEVHMMLFEEILVILQKQEDKLLLRSLSTSIEDAKFLYCPVMKLSSLMVRDVATDKRAFFVLNSVSVSPQVYELLAHSREEKNKWCSYIQEAVKRCGTQYGPTPLPARGTQLCSTMNATDLVTDLVTGSSDDQFDSSHQLASHDSLDQSLRTNKEQTSDRSPNGESNDTSDHHDASERDSSFTAGDLDRCRNKIEAAHSAVTKMRNLEELTTLLNQVLEEKLKLITGGGQVVLSRGVDAEQFQPMDTKDLVNAALSQVRHLMDIISQHSGDVTTSEMLGGVDGITVPAETILGHAAAIQQLMAQLAVRVTSDSTEMERLEENFELVLLKLKAKGSVHSSVLSPEKLSNSPMNWASSSSMSRDGAYLASQANQHLQSIHSGEVHNA